MAFYRYAGLAAAALLAMGGVASARGITVYGVVRADGSCADGCNFDLADFAVSPVYPSNQAGFYEMSADVTVTQTMFVDPLHGSPPASETYLFPSTIDVKVTNDTTGALLSGGINDGNVFLATLSSSPPPGITFTSDDTSATGSAVYTVDIPESGNPVGDTYSFEIEPEQTNGTLFDMVNSVNIAPTTQRVCDPNVVSTVAGQLPEVPWSGALPLVPLAMVSLWWALSRRKQSASPPVA